MSTEVLISRLEGVRETGPGRWISKCPSHPDRSPSLAVRELPGDRTLVHCFALCPVEEVLSAVGLTVGDLFPPRRPTAVGYRPERRPSLPGDVFEIARREIGIVAIIACDMHASKTVTEAGYDRLFVAVERLNGIAGAAYGR